MSPNWSYVKVHMTFIQIWFDRCTLRYSVVLSVCIAAIVDRNK